MKVVVHKYGGSSLSSPESIRYVAARVVEQKRSGCQVVVVVSAMGNTTEELLKLARATSSVFPPRELDLLLTAGEQISMALLSMAIIAAGEEAVSLTGPQAGILTCQEHNRARIMGVRPHRVKAELGQGKVVVVAGFQGVSYTGEVTTLGRGGSDTSAVALATALEAQRCEIYSDVDGVYDADPRVIPGARRLDLVDYDEMLEMARAGARVLNADAVEMARAAGLTIWTGATRQAGPGTFVRAKSGPAEQQLAIACRADLLWLNLDEPESGPTLVELLGASEVMEKSPRELLLRGENSPDVATLRRHALEHFPKGVLCDLVAGVTLVGKAARELQSRGGEALAQQGIPVLRVYERPLSVT